ncbi:beta-lactamase/transpeptidase-like protein [Acephala macrosclerotiorum]|nr:beta-lactamase/transpeptidase-like protein [Acephala macrosclerotiorum]
MEGLSQPAIEKSIGSLDLRISTIEELIKAQPTEDKSIHDILVDFGTPFFSLAVLDKGEITAKVIGCPDPEGNANSAIAKGLDNDTIFQAASISKPITAMAVVKLCQEGKLDLDTPISKYLSQKQLTWISNPKTLPLVSHVTLRHLLSHTSGLSCHGFTGYATVPIPTIEQILRGELPANNEKITMSVLPGQKLSYSGGGITVVQLILETCLKKPFPEIMDEMVLKPLQMTRSTFQFLAPTETNYAPAHLNGKQVATPDHYSLPESAAAGLWTTPTDLLKAIHAMQKSLESNDFLDRRWAREMLTENGDFGFGIGWCVKKGEVQFGHAGGNDPGYACFVAGYAELPTRKDEAVEKKPDFVPKHCGICVMTSSRLGSVVYQKIVAGIAYLKNLPVIPELQGVPFMDRKKGIDERAKEWCGTWGPGDWTLGDSGGLFIQCGAFPALSLIPAALPPYTYEQGDSIDLVVDGLEMMLRLGWKDNSRIVEVWQDEVTLLERQ